MLYDIIGLTSTTEPAVTASSTASDVRLFRSVLALQLEYAFEDEVLQLIHQGHFGSDSDWVRRLSTRQLHRRLLVAFGRRKAQDFGKAHALERSTRFATFTCKLLSEGEVGRPGRIALTLTIATLQLHQAPFSGKAIFSVGDRGERHLDSIVWQRHDASTERVEQGFHSRLKKFAAKNSVSLSAVSV